MVVVSHCCAIPVGGVTVVPMVTPAKNSSRSFAMVVFTDGAVVVRVPELYNPLLASIGVALLTPA